MKVCAVLLCAAASLGAAAFTPYRFDDHLQSAAISAPHAASSARVTEPIVWQDFYSEKDVTWRVLRGNLGFRNGDLMVKGDGGSPVITSPKETPIDWTQFEAVEIRMLSHSGKEIKIKIGTFESKQKLGAPGQYEAYRFDVNVNAPRESWPLALMPTDAPDDLVAIHSIKLIPKSANFRQPVGREFIGKRDEYRNALYAHSPSSVTFQAPVPKAGRLHFAIGVAEKDKPVRFRVALNGVEVFARDLADSGVWEDADVDLSAYGGRTAKLEFKTDSERPGAVGLWANPLLTTREAKGRPNILIYTIDTMRADHTSLYGYTRDTTPFLKKLGASGVVFDDCQAQASSTKPSTASLMTSLYSYTHGIVNDFDTIPKGASTLAEQLRAGGYVTASAVANPYAGRTTGLERGFDYLTEYPVILRNRNEALDRGTDSAALNKSLLPWLDRHSDEPFFLYAHATDPHAPYRPPAAYEKEFANPAETAEFDRDYAKLRDQRQYGGGTVVNREGCTKAGVNPDKFIRRAMDRYDGEIAHNDSQLSLLLDKLKQRGVLENTLVIVISDHGEEFWDHGWTAHGHSLYQELTHTALLLWNPHLLPTPRRVSSPVQLIDVMPTVLEIAGLKAPETAEGQSLLPLAKGLPFQRRGAVMSSRFAHPQAKATGFVPENRTDTFSMMDARWKLIYRDKAKEAGLPAVELYDRTADRAETRNVASQHAREVARMMDEMGKWIEAQKKLRSVLGHGAKSTLDENTLEQLRSLGYLGGKTP